jgi:hypothetical protein
MCPINAESPDFDSSWDLHHEDIQNSIVECAGPERKLLMTKCGAGLGRAWGWSEKLNRIQSSEDILPLLKDFTPRLSDAWMINITPEQAEASREVFNLLYDTSGFAESRDMRLTRTINGQTRTINKGTVITVKLARHDICKSLSDVCLVETAGSESSYAFRKPAQTEDKNTLKHVLAHGIYSFINHTEKDLEESDYLIKCMNEATVKLHESIQKALNSLYP